MNTMIMQNKQPFSSIAQMRLGAQKEVNWCRWVVRQPTKLATAIFPKRVRNLSKVSWRTKMRG